jgi:hypothetical protein
MRIAPVSEPLALAIRDRCGSLAAKVTLLERMAAFSQEAEPNQACFSVLFCSEFGQQRLTKSRRFRRMLTS